VAAIASVAVITTAIVAPASVSNSRVDLEFRVLVTVVMMLLSQTRRWGEERRSPEASSSDAVRPMVRSRNSIDSIERRLAMAVVVFVERTVM
jgi:hypothetical protein